MKHKFLNPMKSYLKSRLGGFTIIETLIVIFVFTLITGALSGLLIMAYRNYGYIFQQAQAIDEARKGIKTMIKEIREARFGDEGSYPIERADNKEFIFYSDVDDDGDTERVRYSLGTVSAGEQTQECVSFGSGGFCDTVFSNFLSGDLEYAEVKLYLEGDLGLASEYVEIFADGTKLGDACISGCSDCAEAWQGVAIFDVTSQAEDDYIQLTADSSSEVGAFCDWVESDHSIKVKFVFSWTEDMPESSNEFKKGIIEPTAPPIQYPLSQEKVYTISSYVRNSPPIFRYFDENGQEITDRAERLRNTKTIELYLIINVNPYRTPEEFELKSSVQLRNLKEE